MKNKTLSFEERRLSRFPQIKSNLEEFGSIIFDEAEVLYRTPGWAYAAIEAVENLGEIYEGQAYNPIRGLFMVGSLSRKNIGHVETYEYVKNNIKTISGKDLWNKVRKIKTRHQDLDLYMILQNVTPKTKIDITNQFRNILPKPPSYIPETFDGYDLNDASVVTQEQLIYRLSKGSFTGHEHYLFGKNPKKEEIPVILFQNERMHPVLRTEFEELKEGRCLRDIETYISETWRPYVKKFKNEFPNINKLIIESINSEIDKVEFKITNPDVISLLKQNIFL